MLGLYKSSDDDSENVPMDDWIQDNKTKMLEASKLALSNTEKSAEQRNHQKKKESQCFIHPSWNKSSYEKPRPWKE